MNVYDFPDPRLPFEHNSFDSRRIDLPIPVLTGRVRPVEDERYIADEIPLVDYRVAHGTYLAWLDMRDVAERIGADEMAAEAWESSGEVITPEQVVQLWLAQNAGVFLSPGSSYGTGGAGRMRMNVATPRSLLERGLENIASALA